MNSRPQQWRGEGYSIGKKKRIRESKRRNIIEILKVGERVGGNGRRSCSVLGNSFKNGEFGGMDIGKKGRGE